MRVQLLDRPSTEGLRDYLLLISVLACRYGAFQNQHHHHHQQSILLSWATNRVGSSPSRGIPFLRIITPDASASRATVRDAQSMIISLLLRVPFQACSSKYSMRASL